MGSGCFFDVILAVLVHVCALDRPDLCKVVVVPPIVFALLRWMVLLVGMIRSSRGSLRRGGARFSAV